MSLTILVADDDLGTRLSIADFLELAGYFVVTAEDGRIALDLVNQHQPHLLITDISMPRMNGYDLVHEIRRQPAFRLLPVIFLTEHTSVEERIRGYQSGCDVYLPKPFILKELGAVVRNLLERSQLIQTEWRVRAQSTSLDGSRSDGNNGHTAESVANERRSHTVTVQSLDLTPREQEVLSLVSEGLSNAQIGQQLHLSPRTVEKHVSRLLRKTETVNRAELVRFNMDHQLVD
ncbi:MAG: response regulator transcription factor [Leptolyngbyaceae bacterium]|nr:response regulator transcription factor [Leptolyngbyaceae bacterium]